MRLTIDARLISSSGIGGYLQNIINSAVVDKYDLRLLYREEDKEYFHNFLTQVELERYDADLYSVKELLQTPGKTYDTDIFWSPHYNIPLFNHAEKLKVVTIHDVFHLAFYKMLSLSQKIYARFMISQALKSDLIFTVSEFSKNEILKHIKCDPDKIKVVYNGIDFERFNTPPVEQERRTVFDRYGIMQPYILYVGNIKPHKNLRGALFGFREFINRGGKQYQDYRFIIVGQREGFITGDKKINELLADPFYQKHIHFTGWIHNKHLPALYQNACAFVFPSVYEGFGFPPLEAMAAGCPVASSNAACLPEVYGDAVHYFNPHSHVEIGEALLNIISDKSVRSSLIQKGFKQAKKYTWENAVEKKLSLLEEYTTLVSK